jgi:hypothetical protein
MESWHGQTIALPSLAEITVIMWGFQGDPGCEFEAVFPQFSLVNTTAYRTTIRQPGECRACPHHPSERHNICWGDHRFSSNGTGFLPSRPIRRSTPILQRISRIARQIPASSAILTYQTIPDHRRYISLFLQTAIDLAQQKHALPSNFIFSDYYISHTGIPGIGSVGGDIDLIIASTQGHVPPTQGLRARCIPDEIRFFVTLPRLGHTGEWTKDMAVM